MNVISRAAVIAALIVAAGCGGSAEEPDPDAFLAEVRDIGNGLFEPISDDLIMEAGNGFCDLSEAATSKDEYTSHVFAAIATSDGITPERSVAYVLEAGAALQYLCPEQADRWGN